MRQLRHRGRGNGVGRPSRPRAWPLEPGACVSHRRWARHRRGWRRPRGRSLPARRSSSHRGGQHLEEGGQWVSAPARVDVVLALAGPLWIRQEPKPGVGVEAGRARADELLPRQVAMDDPVFCRQVPTEGERHVPVLPPSPGPAHLPARPEEMVHRPWNPAVIEHRQLAADLWGPSVAAEEAVHDS